MIRALAAAGIAAAALPAAAAGDWRQAGELTPARIGHTATATAAGHVVVAGGRVSLLRVTRTVRAYDPSFDPLGRRIRSLRARPQSSHSIRLTFRPPTPWRAAPAMQTARAEHSATRLGDGRILVAGGNASAGGPSATAEILDPARGAWRPAAPLTVARESHTATLLPDGRVLVAGGRGADGNALASAEIYDPRADAWTTAAPLATPRLQHTATALADGRVLVAGGASARDPRRVPEFLPTATAEVYDPATGAWSSPGCPATAPGAGEPSACLHQARSRHTATLLADGTVLVAGGADDRDAPRRSAELFDPSTQAWRATASMLEGRAEHTATAAGGAVVVAGGRSDDAAAVEAYDPAARRWSAAPALAGPRRAHTATLLTGPGCAPRCGEILVTGGRADTTFGAAPLFLDGAELFGTGSGPPPARGAAPDRYVVKQSRRPIRSVRAFARARSLCRRACRIADRPGGAAALTVTGLKPGATYHYAIRAVTAGRRGPISNPSRARTSRDRVAPGRVRGLTARRVAPDRVRLTFRAAADDGRRGPPVRRYLIKQAPTPIDSGERFAGALTICPRCRFAPRRVGATLTVTVSDLEPGSDYHYAIRARDDGGNLGPRTPSVRAGATG